ncbi:unnamed protein product, partial [Discosporangium mesarthrocarpum]
QILDRVHTGGNTTNTNVKGQSPMTDMYRGRHQQPTPRKRRLVTYQLKPLNDQEGFVGPQHHGHRFGINRIVRVGDGDLLTAGRDGIVRRWDVSDALGFVAGEEAAKHSSRGRDSPSGSSFGGFGGGGGANDGGGLEGTPGNDGNHNPDPNSKPLPQCTGVFASHTDWVTSLAVAKGRVMISGSHDGSVKLWDLACSPMPATVEVGVGGNGLGEEAGNSGHDVGRGEGSPSMGHAAMGATNGGSEASGDRATLGSHPLSRTLPQPAPARPSPLMTGAGHADYVKCLAYAPGRDLLVSGGLDKRILSWDIRRITTPVAVLVDGEG